MAAVAALALGVAGCQDTTEPDVTTDRPATAGGADTGRDAAPAPLRVSGCLQQADGDFVLTRQPDDVSAERPGQPQAAQLDAARDSYRLSGDDDRFEALVGNRVQVTGTVEERADLPRLEPRGTLERPREDRAQELDLDASQLAQLNVTSIESSGAPCGHGNESANDASS